MKLESKLCNESLMFEEVKLKFYKDILKSLYGDEPEKVTFFTTILDVSTSLTNKPKDYFTNLNCLDYFVFLLDLRMSILGPTCSINIQQNNKQMRLNLDLSLLKEDLISAFKDRIKKTLTIDNKIFVELECPSFSRLLNAKEADQYIQFIKKISIKKDKDFVTTIKISTNEQAEEVFNQLQPKLSIQIIEFAKDFFEHCSKNNLLKRYKLKEQQTLHFAPSLDILIWFLKLLFNEQLNVIYDNLFYLSYSGKMDLSYIENCTVGEYVYFVNTLRGILSQKNQQPSVPLQSEDQMNDPV